MKLKAFLAAAAFVFVPTLVAGAITTGSLDNGTQQNIVGITGFTTTGNQMAGLTVTVGFSNSTSSSCN